MIRETRNTSELSCCGVWLKRSLGFTLRRCVAVARLIDNRLDILHGSHRVGNSREERISSGSCYNDKFKFSLSNETLVLGVFAHIYKQGEWLF